MRRKHEERHNGSERDGDERAETCDRPTTARGPPRPHERNRQQDDGIHLGREGQAQDRERNDVPTGNEKRERGNRQQRRPRVVGVERDRPERNR